MSTKKTKVKLAALGVVVAASLYAVAYKVGEDNGKERKNVIIACMGEAGWKKVKEKAENIGNLAPIDAAYRKCKGS